MKNFHEIQDKIKTQIVDLDSNIKAYKGNECEIVNTVKSQLC